MNKTKIGSDKYGSNSHKHKRSPGGQVETHGGCIKAGGSFWDNVDKLYNEAIKKHSEKMTVAQDRKVTTQFKPTGDAWRR